MNVLVIGGTRGLGRAVVVAAHDAGHRVTVLARNVANFPQPGIRLVVGDAADATDVERAVAGHEAVVWAAGIRPTRRAVDLFSRGTQFLLASMARHAARRLVCVTGSRGGAGRPRAGNLFRRIVFPTFGKSMHDDQFRQLAQIRASSLDWTIVCPAAMRDGPATGAFQVLTATDTNRTWHVARADVAAFIVANLAGDSYRHQTVSLTA